ncbi:Phosphopantetheine attachment site [Amycolatopsis pretoriensis]|uniref:Phosphopantetheine attachment site n=1 Tax=Amycolatopsis pretoriensis TaxID=218821 RepID=A0A1H5QM30_9PSEU|nr:type I polyketide synthase [Amycolatopsis pretoriensis]SEF26237.1 Phosphopantetheine attachment site [Amycolatopsis pretoriensis]
MNDPDELRRWLTERIAGLAGLAPELVDAGVPLAELGLSSRDAATVAAELGELLGREPDLGLLGRYPSIAALATALAGRDTRPRPRAGEPVAVLGIGCRLPGIESPDELWRALLAGASGGASGAGFDAAFFGIDVAEAAEMDPRERLLLETTWAAFEHAGIAPSTVRGSRTGVFAGGSVRTTGVSDRFDLRGPSLTVDAEGTASLAAVHQAARALSAGEADVVVVAGVSEAVAGVAVLKRLADARRDGDRVLAVIRGSAVGAGGAEVLADAHAVAGSDPATVDYVETQGAEAGALEGVFGRNREGRPLLVGAPAAGMGDLGAAAGIFGLIKVVLALWHNRIPPAGWPALPSSAEWPAPPSQRPGAPDLTSVDSAADHPGPASQRLGASGLPPADSSPDWPAPSSPQSGAAGLSDEDEPADRPAPPSQRSGTPGLPPVDSSPDWPAPSSPQSGAAGLSPVGDPAEWSVPPGSQSGTPGVKGGWPAPPSQRASATGPSPVDNPAEWPAPPGSQSGTPGVEGAQPGPPSRRPGAPSLSLGTKPADWPRYGGTARAGVSAFGRTGAHLVLEEWPKPLTPAAPGSRWNGRPQVFSLSAHSETALRRRAGALADWLAGPGRGVAPGDLAAALARRRDHLPLRAAVVTSSRTALAAGLRALADGRTTADVVRDTAGRDRPRPVFVFSGNGSQWPAMGRRMLGAEPEFRAAVTALEPVFLARAGFSLRGALRRPLGDPTVVAPLVYGTQVALANWWRAHGVEPAAVLGHSTGEVAAAVVAGALDVGDGLDIVVTTAGLLAELPPTAMAVVELPAGEVDEPGLTVVEYSSPTQCTVAGDAEHIAALVSRVDGMGRLARRLEGTGHTAAVEPILGRFRAALGDLRHRSPTTTCYSSASDDPVFDVDHWVATLRRPVRFTQAVAAAVADGHRWFVEVSPHPIALPAVEQTAAGVRTLASLSRRDGEENAFARSLAELHAAGHPAVLDRRYPEAPVLDLPPPPWDHRPFRRPRRTTSHPLLGARVEVPGEDRHLWQTAIAPDAPAWLDGHRVHDVPVFPATGFLELFLAGARELFGTGRVRVDGLEVHRVLAVTGETLLSTEIRVDGTAVVRAKAGAGWVRHATAWVSPDTDPAPAALSEVDKNLPTVPKGYALHPILADACFEAGEPAAFGRVRLLGDASRGARVRTDGAGTVQLGTEDGEVVADFADVRFRAPGDVPLAARAFGTTWAEVPLTGPGEPGSWLLLTDEHPAALGRAVALALALAAAGDEALSLPQDDLDELPGFLAERPVRGVVFLAGAPHAYHDPEDARDLLDTVRSVVARLGPDVRFHLVTQSSGEPGLAFLRGFVRVLAFDRPELRATLVDCDARSDVDVLARELRSAAPDDEVRWRHDVRYAARLTRVPLVDGGSTGPGAYVVTGGDTLSLATARWLASGGATRIVLCGLGEIELPGVDVVVVDGDIAAPGVAERLVAAATEDGLPLRGIVHAANVAGDGVAAVWRPKVLGARRLHEATAGTPPEWWLTYASTAALFGAPGETAHATADAWLDAFAAWRRSRGLPATTVHWGALPDAVEALPAVLAADRPSVGIARPDANRDFVRRPYFSGVMAGVPAVATPRDRLADIVAGLLGRAAAPDVPLVELGLDSLTAMRARAAVEREFGVALPVPLLLGGARLDDLAGYVTGTTVPVRTRRGGTPLVLFGEPGVYRPLREHLGDVPCHVLDVSDVDAGVARLREVRPAGPYRLGGWAAGGVLAYETARRLTALGERVDVVVLFATDAPPDPEPYAGRVVLYLTARQAAAGWAECCSDLHVEVVPGDHRSMLEPPHVRHLAAELAGRTSPGTTPV